MKVLFDQGTPVPLRKHLSAHQVSTAYELGWSQLENGNLLQKAEQEGFQVMVTTDQNLRYQQNLASRAIAIVVIGSTSWPRIQSVIADVAEAIYASQSMPAFGYLRASANGKCTPETPAAASWSNSDRLLSR